ncbi:hypothetical protein PybrP1_008310 [[Pythium] brassicae (nom. inval.)]|nr:hypothetical protein PybrP1_008310 [[Pythium] brassicae (nom. inval.)]
MKSAAHRQCLTLAQKRALIDYCAHHPAITRRELSEWAMNAFSLPHHLPKSTLRGILRDGVLLESSTTHSPCRKATHTARPLQLGAALDAWIRKYEALRVAVATGTTIWQKARKIRREQLIDETLHPGEAKHFVSLTFKAGWLAFFQAHHHLKARQAHDGAGSASLVVVELGREPLRGTTSRTPRLSAAIKP